MDTLARPAAPVEPVSEFAARARAACARLIRKVYEADPLECPKCKGPAGQKFHTTVIFFLGALYE